MQRASNGPTWPSTCIQETPPTPAYGWRTTSSSQLTSLGQRYARTYRDMQGIYKCRDIWGYTGKRMTFMFATVPACVTPSHTHACTHTHTHTHTCTHTTHTHTHTHTHMHTHTHTHTCMRTHIHAHMCTHTCTQGMEGHVAFVLFLLGCD